jgi:hypothetical protein
MLQTASRGATCAPMTYTRKVTDLDTGETRWENLGPHLPLTDAALQMGYGPRSFRRMLVELGLLQREHDAKAGEDRHRLSPWAVANGFGIRVDRKWIKHRDGLVPFDVLSPEGMDYVRENLSSAVAKVRRAAAGPAQDAREALSKYEQARGRALDPEGRVRWIQHHFAGLTEREVAEALGVSQALVNRYGNRRRKQVGVLKATLAKPLADVRGEHASLLAILKGYLTDAPATA